MARPFGSRTGVCPADGYPDLKPADGSFLAGFLEGEASFQVSKQPRKANHRCSVRVNVRDDDASLMAELREITRLGRIRRNPARGSSAPQVCWAIDTRADSLRLSQLLERYPLRAHKAGDADLWCAAVHWWTDGQPSHATSGRDWAPMVYLRSRLLERRRTDRVPRPIVDSAGRGLTEDWAGFLAGFFTAEGSLGLYPSAASLLQPVAQVRLRWDDEPLLREFAARTGAGRVYPASPTTAREANFRSWIIRSRMDLRRIVHVFDSAAPRGRKFLEYEMWRDAIWLYCDRPPGYRLRLATLREQLSAAKRYVPPA